MFAFVFVFAPWRKHVGEPETQSLRKPSLCLVAVVVADVVAAGGLGAVSSMHRRHRYRYRQLMFR